MRKCLSAHERELMDIATAVEKQFRPAPQAASKIGVEVELIAVTDSVAAARRPCKACGRLRRFLRTSGAAQL
jgi:hypothetical protein